MSRMGPVIRADAKKCSRRIHKNKYTHFTACFPPACSCVKGKLEKVQTQFCRRSLEFVSKNCFFNSIFKLFYPNFSQATGNNRPKNPLDIQGRNPGSESDDKSKNKIHKSSQKKEREKRRRGRKSTSELQPNFRLTSGGWKSKLILVETKRRQTDLGRGELNFWVVLDLPQSFVEAFPLVGLGVLLFVGLVGEDVFGAEEGSGGGKIVLRGFVHLILCEALKM